MSLAIIGGTVVDLIFPRLRRLPVWPRHTEFTPANLVLVHEPPIVTLGGNGANAAYAAACGGADVTLYSHVGDDSLGRLARDWLERVGCRLEGSIPRAATAVNVTAANARHHRATLYHPGPAITALPVFRAGGSTPTHALVCGWPHPPLPAIAEGLRRLRRQKVVTALDAGPILDRPWSLPALKPVLAALDLFLANEYELRAITRADSLSAALRRLRERYDGHVVVKRGSKGALWMPAGGTAAQTAVGRKVTAVNTVGAGDCFNGALLAALDGGAPFPAALEHACSVAASAVSSPRGVLGIEPQRSRRRHVG